MLREVISWVGITKEYKEYPLNNLLMDWCIAISTSGMREIPMPAKWFPPKEGFLKMNFDGAPRRNLGPGGFGGVIRNSSSHVICVICGPLAKCESTKAETIGLLMDLQELKKMGAYGTMVEGDSSSVIGWGKGTGEGVWRLANFLNEIHDLSIQLGISYAHIPRE